MPKKNRPASIEYLKELIEFVSVYAKNKGFSAKRIKDIELVAEESLVNIISYAYPGGVGEVEVICRTEDDSRLIIEILDEGIPFDILSLPSPDLTGDISDRQVGGVGVVLIRKMVDDASYLRAGGKNILRFVFCPDFVPAAKTRPLNSPNKNRRGFEPY